MTINLKSLINSQATAQDSNLTMSPKTQHKSGNSPLANRLMPQVLANEKDDKRNNSSERESSNTRKKPSTPRSQDDEKREKNPIKKKTFEEDKDEKSPSSDKKRIQRKSIY